MPQTAAPSIGTVAPRRDASTDPHTGEPRRPAVVWVACGLFYAGVATVVAGMLQAFWLSVHAFADAAWLNAVVATEPGALLRVALVTGLFVIALLVGASSVIAGYYAWLGYRWTRWAGLVALALAALALMVNPLAAWGIAPIAVAAGLLWLPQSRSFFARWHLRRHPAAPAPPAVGEVHYGPLPRYR